MKKLIILIVAIAAFGTTSFAQQSVTANATATLITPLTLTDVRTLDFGTAASTTSASTVIIAATSAGARSGTANLISSAVGASAKFHVVGTANATYTFTHDAGTTMTGPASGVTVSAITALYTGNLGAGNAEDIYVGATLNIPANQVAGSYTGTYNVSVAYN